MTQSQTPEQAPAKSVGRNEPCPCGSGKKFKRCCGVDAAPKLTTPKMAAPAEGSPWNPEVMSQMDPQMMLQVGQALQRLPKGQLQRLQSIMQKAMSGKDVTEEAQELEKSLPADFQEMMRSFALAASAAQMSAESSNETSAALTEPMTVEKAREVIAQAAREGKITKEEADTLLAAQNKAAAPAQLEHQAPGAHVSGEEGQPQVETIQEVPSSETVQPLPQGSEGPSKIGKFWKGLVGKNK